MAFRNKHHKYFEAHHEQCLARSRAWKAKNRKRNLAYMRRYMRRRLSKVMARFIKIDLGILRRAGLIDKLSSKVDTDAAPVETLRFIDQLIKYST